MSHEEIKAALLAILRRITPEADLEAVKPDDNLRTTLDIDSFDALNFFVRIDEVFGISVPESDYGRLHTLADLIRYIADRQQ